MSKLIITTNNHRRPILYGYELTDDERTEFEYYDSDEVRDQEFFRYKGEIYDLGEFQMVNHQILTDLANWDAILHDTFFSGVLIRHPREEWGELDTEHIVVGWYYVGSDSM